jgi:hypothetical protein
MAKTKQCPNCTRKIDPKFAQCFYCNKEGKKVPVAPNAEPPKKRKVKETWQERYDNY